MYLERDSTPFFSRILCYFLTFGSSGLNCGFIGNEYGFSTNLKISFISSGDQAILTLKISVTNVCRFEYFVDFDIKILLLG